MLILSEKDKVFFSIRANREYLEGTTASGKTTKGITKYMSLVADDYEVNDHGEGDNPIEFKEIKEDN